MTTGSPLSGVRPLSEDEEGDVRDRAADHAYMGWAERDVRPVDPLPRAAKAACDAYDEWMRRANDPDSFLPTHTRVGASQSQAAHDRFMRSMGNLRAALRAAQPAPTAGLDVERLARAMARAFGTSKTHTPEQAEEHWESDMPDAIAIAREYAALRPSEAGEAPPDDWEESERRADADIEAGRVREFTDAGQARVWLEAGEAQREETP